MIATPAASVTGSPTILIDSSVPAREDETFRQ
jgi:hypothetical protein